MILLVRNSDKPWWRCLFSVSYIWGPQLGWLKILGGLAGMAWLKSYVSVSWIHQFSSMWSLHVTSLDFFIAPWSQGGWVSLSNIWLPVGTRSCLFCSNINLGLAQHNFRYAYCPSQVRRPALIEGEIDLIMVSGVAYASRQGRKGKQPLWETNYHLPFPVLLTPL